MHVYSYVQEIDCRLVDISEQIMASGRVSSYGMATLSLVPVLSCWPDLIVNRYSPMVPAVFPRGSILKLVNVGRVLIVTDIPVLNV